MVIAGGTFQCPIIKTASSMGHYVICSNLYENSPAFEFADACEVADVLDRGRNLSIARRYQPDAVLTDQTDIAVPTVAYLAQELGLRGIGIEVAERFHNKFIMREFTSLSGFASPRYRRCHTVEEAKDFLREVPSAIIKPLDSQSSRGVHIIRTSRDVDRFFADCIQYSNAEEAVLAEEYIDGTEFTVDGLKTTSDYVVTAISEKEHFSHNASIASRLLFSQTSDLYDYDALREVNTEIVRAMGLPFGLTHAEYKWRNGQFYLIEIAARGGGTMISSDVVPLVSGIDSNKVFINTLLGKPDKPVVGPHYTYAVLGFFDIEPGRIVDIRGLDQVEQLPGVQLARLDVSVGDQLLRAQDDRSRCGYYIVYADDLEELSVREQLLKDTVKVVTE